MDKITAIKGEYQNQDDVVVQIDRQTIRSEKISGRVIKQKIATLQAEIARLNSLLGQVTATIQTSGIKIPVKAVKSDTQSGRT